MCSRSGVAAVKRASELCRSPLLKASKARFSREVMAVILVQGTKKPPGRVSRPQGHRLDFSEARHHFVHASLSPDTGVLARLWASVHCATSPAFVCHRTRAHTVCALYNVWFYPPPCPQSAA